MPAPVRELGGDGVEVRATASDPRTFASPWVRAKNQTCRAGPGRGIRLGAGRTGDDSEEWHMLHRIADELGGGVVVAAGVTAAPPRVGA